MVTVVPVTFRFPTRLAPTARMLSLVGSFNGWNPTVHPMRRTDNDAWTITVNLSPGRAVHLFSVDGVIGSTQAMMVAYGSRFVVYHASVKGYQTW
jgi:1,4-alpha-glucan branching enzyme